MLGMDWQGVFPALTTQFRSDQSLDLEATAHQIERLLLAGVDGLIMLGSLGENTALSAAEKRQVLEMAVAQAKGRVPVLSGVAECTTAAAADYARDLQKLGVDGLMLLPAMVYRSDPRETLHHFRKVARASDLPIMIYNNPVSYGVDLTPDLLAELAEERTLVAIKESSDNVRRITDIRNRVEDRFVLFTGVDDIALESLLLGADGWVAGLVNAFPEETVALYRYAKAGQLSKALPLYRWFMPLLHLDISTKLVQNIKLVQAEMGQGTETVRAPRLPLVGEERDRVLAILAAAKDNRPEL